MRARIRTETYHIDFTGSPQLWNEFLRPLLGGPEAPDEAREPAPEPVVPESPRRPERPHTAPMVVRPDYAAARFEEDRMHPASRRPERPERQVRREPPARHLGGDESRGGARQPRRPAGPEAPAVAPSSDPRTLYRRLAGIGRRGEKDAVVAAVWFVAEGGHRDVTPDEVQVHLRDHGVPADLKVRPHLLKHVSRTKLLENGESPGSIRLSRKGHAYVRDRLVGG